MSDHESESYSEDHESESYSEDKSKKRFSILQFLGIDKAEDEFGVELNIGQQWNRLIMLQFIFAFTFLINCTVLLALFKRNETQTIFLNETKWIKDFNDMCQIQKLSK